MPQKLSNQNFIEKSKKIHGNKYDYSKVDYVNNHTKVCIICPEHGEFWQTPNSHLNGNGCPKCGNNLAHQKNTKSTQQFIEEASIMHNGKYDYSKSKYIGRDKKVCIICPEHGEFWQSPHNHLNGAGCPECKKETLSKKYCDGKNGFIEKAKKVHGNKYDYSKVEYIDSHTKVCIICPEHGEFWQKPNNHLHGWGCAKCSKRKKKTTEEFINESKSLYPEKYTYEKTEYKNNKTPLIITCKKHGDFSSYPNDHLKGQECPFCSLYKLESDIKTLLDKENIEYIYQYTKGFIGTQRIDFYLPFHKIAIECQGEQHYMPVKFFGGEEKYKYQKTNDRKKRKLCQENGVTMIYYTSQKIFESHKRSLAKNTYTSAEEILNIIKTRDI